MYAFLICSTVHPCLPTPRIWKECSNLAMGLSWERSTHLLPSEPPVRLDLKKYLTDKFGVAKFQRRVKERQKSWRAGEKHRDIWIVAYIHVASVLSATFQMKLICKLVMSSGMGVCDLRVASSTCTMLKIPARLKSTLHGRKFDAVVIGGGHNGLIAVRLCASLPARQYQYMHLYQLPGRSK